ncbi:MAG: hypothetical protein J0I91_19965, partial [Candidatus Accumulibacter sp.]|nr:hypothetical protein [Accumulibacter sp.]
RSPASGNGDAVGERRDVRRHALALLAAARAWAFIDGRDMVLPEDVQAVLPGVACHRLRHAHSGALARPADIAALAHGVAIP